MSELTDKIAHLRKIVREDGGFSGRERQPFFGIADALEDIACELERHDQSLRMDKTDILNGVSPSSLIIVLRGVLSDLEQLKAWRESGSLLHTKPGPIKLPDTRLVVPAECQVLTPPIYIPAFVDHLCSSKKYPARGFISGEASVGDAFVNAQDRTILKEIVSAAVEDYLNRFHIAVSKEEKQ